MSVPEIIRLACLSILEKVESCLLSLPGQFSRSRYSILIIALNDNKAVLPAFICSASIIQGSYKYESDSCS